MKKEKIGCPITLGEYEEIIKKEKKEYEEMIMREKEDKE